MKLSKSKKIIALIVGSVSLVLLINLSGVSAASKVDDVLQNLRSILRNLQFQENAPSEQARQTHVYLAQWEWFCESGDDCSWRAPGGGNVGALDLRTLPQMGKAGGTPEGYGIFAYKEQRTIPGSLYLGTDLNRILTPGEKNAIRARFKIAMGSLTPLDAMWDMLTTYSDPTGEIGPKPLMPTVEGNLELHMGGFSLVRSKKLDASSPEWPAVLAGLREQYRQIRKERVEQPEFADIHKRVLGTWMQKYPFVADYRIFIPTDLPDEGMLEPHTTITDIFDRADSTTLGTSSEGWSWTEVQNDIDIVADQASQQGTTQADARAESDLSTDDHYSQFNIIASSIDSNKGGPAVRFAAAANTHYHYDASRGNADLHEIKKVITGTETNLFSNNTNEIASGDMLRLEVDGSLLTALAAGVARVNGSDTSITGNLRTGIRLDANGTNRVQANNFEAGDLPVPSAKIQGGTKIQGGAKIQ